MFTNSFNAKPSLPEITALQEVSKSGPPSEHIVRALDYWRYMDKRLLISRTLIKLERCDETLEDYLSNLQRCKKSVGARDLIEIMSQILSGVAHCHARKVVHRDLKEKNSMPSS